VAVGLALWSLGACTTGSTGSQSTDGSTSTPPAPSRAAVRPTVGSARPHVPAPAPTVSARVLPWRLPAALSRSVAIRYGGQHSALLAGGLGPGDASTDEVLRIDLRTGAARREAPLVEPLHDSAGALLAGRPVIVGGGGAAELDGVERLDRHGTWRLAGHLPGARSDLSVVAARHGLLVVGGYDGTRTPRAVLRTTDGARFERTGRLPLGVRYAGVARTGRWVWVLGGEVAGRELDEVLRVDTRTGHVRTVGRLPRPLGHEAVVAVAGRLLVMGGRTAPDAVTDALTWYDPRTHRWSRAGHLPYPVADAPAVVVGHHVFLLGGETPDFTARTTEVTWTR
jgi:Kelch motif protein